MAVKYSVQYRDSFNQKCRVDIATDDYNGEPKILRGAGGSACTISRDCPDDPSHPIINSKASITFLQTEDFPVDIAELQRAQDRVFTVKMYVENALKFSGFMVADGIRRPFKPATFSVNINAVDGLSLLDGIPYTHQDLEGERCTINYFRNILFSEDNLGNPLPLQWVNTLTNDEFPLEEDVFSGSLQWAASGEGFFELKDGEPIYKDCNYILEGLLRSMRCRIVQDDGIWKIQRINDIVTGEFTIREMEATLEGFDITDREINVNKTIRGKNDEGDYSFIEEDAELAILPALKTVTAIYQQDERENILPNGDMDITETLVTEEIVPINWISTSPANLFFESRDSLYSPRGKAVLINSTDSSGKYFEMVKPLPIDSDVLYETMNIGFKFMPISGFPLNGDGTIDWDAGDQFLYLVTFHDNDSDIWYLNEFGFWTKDFVALISPRVDGLKEGEVAQIDFNKFQNIPLVIPATVPIGRTNEPAIKISFFVPAVCQFALDDVYIKVPSANDKYEATFLESKNTAKEEYPLSISSSHNGFYISSFMTEFGEAGKQKFFSDAITQGVTLTNMFAQSVMRTRYIPSDVFEGSILGRNYSYAEIYDVKTLIDKKFLPLKSNWNTETNQIQLTCVEIRNDDISLQVKQNGVDYSTEPEDELEE